MQTVSRFRSRSEAHGIWLNHLRQHQAIAVIRARSFRQGLKMATAVADAGMKLIEITWNSDRPGRLIEYLRAQYPACQVGVGTILSKTALKDAIAAGAQFAFSPHTDANLIQLSEALGCPMTAGAFSPTEIVTAWQAGASSVKVFPVQSVGGPNYIKNLQGPMGHIPLIPTGGITLEAAQAYLDAGAIAIGVASCLFLPTFMDTENWLGLTAHIAKFRSTYAE